jgi:hypothetical protein
VADTTLTFDILAKDRASAAFDSAGKSSDTLGSKIKGLASVAAVSLAAGVGAEFLKGAIENARESIKVSAQTEAVLKSTGGAANVNAEALGKYAHQLQNVSGVSDEVIQSGANMLLTFTNIKNGVGAGNDVFNQATKTLLDMSVALGTDASTSAVQLGKALNDPIAGVSALQRVGVTFTETQKEQIATMVQAGDTMGAQKLILAELNKEFGGSAAAQGAAMDSGQRLAMKWGDLQEQVGTWLIPKIESLINVLLTTVDWYERNKATLDPLIIALGAFAAVVVTVVTAVKIWTAIQTALDIVLAANPIGLVVIAVTALAAGLVFAYQKSETFRDVVSVAFDVVKDYAGIVRAEIGFIVNVIEAVISAARRMGQALSNLPGLDTLGNIAGKIGGVAGRIPGFAGGVTNFDGGLAYVHQGEVLANLPRGTDVIPAAQVRAMSAPDNAEVVARLDALLAAVNRQTDKQWLAGVTSSSGLR